MNVALQKRLEQLERWRQNEADVELKQQQLANDQTSNQQLRNINLTRTSSASPIITRRNNWIGNDESGSANSFTPTTATTKKGSRKHGRSNHPLQVKFSDSTLFLTACANGDIIECERLLNENLVDIDVTTSDGLTGLHEAAICGNVQLVEYLLKHGANINCCDNEGWTPLHAAASLGQVKIVQILLDHGADATIVNCDNFLAYDLARNDQVQTLIGEHLQDIDIDYLRSQEERAIERDIEKWIKTGHYEERSHPLTNATVLHVLAAKGHVNLMRKILESPLLKKQINLEAKDNEGFTPLLAASFWSQTDIVELLIEHGANIFAQANSGYKISSIHLKNYQQSKLQNPQQLRPRSSIQSIDTNASEASRQTSSLDLSSATDLSHEDSSTSSINKSSSAPRHPKPLAQLLKSRSLESNQHQQHQLQKQQDESNLSTTMSLDRLLLRTEAMSERELRKSYKELVMENEDLKKRLQSVDERDKQKQQEWIRKERQMQRKISELEEENRQLEQWKQEIQHLKDENSSLIRVVTKLSKKN